MPECIKICFKPAIFRFLWHATSQRQTCSMISLVGTQINPHKPTQIHWKMHINTAVIVGASLAASSNAFSTSSSFTRQLPPSRYHDQPSAYRSTASTALSMNLFDRFQRVAKSNINNVLKSLEDPEKIMNQAVEDMQVSLRRIIMGYFWYTEREIEEFLLTYHYYFYRSSFINAPIC